MNREDIIHMAREAGWTSYDSQDERFERFAALVAAAERERIIADNAPEIEKINAYIKALEDELAAIREALEQLAQQESEAVHAAWMAGYTEGEREAIEKQIAQQEPVAWQWLATAHFRKRLPKNAEKGAWNPLYTSPPASKPWVGLTEQERNDLEDYCEMIIGKAAFESIEAKLKEKNA